jgi:transposase
MSIEPHTGFDFAAVEAAVDRPAGSEESRRDGTSRLVRDAVLDELIRDRLSVKEIATRTLALGIFCKHWRLSGKSAQAIADRLGISRASLNRSVRSMRRRFTTSAKSETGNVPSPRAKIAPK